MLASETKYVYLKDGFYTDIYFFSHINFYLKTFKH